MFLGMYEMRRGYFFSNIFGLPVGKYRAINSWNMDRKYISDENKVALTYQRK
jgi:hypothetical protein